MRNFRNYFIYNFGYLDSSPGRFYVKFEFGVRGQILATRRAVLTIQHSINITINNLK